MKIRAPFPFGIRELNAQLKRKGPGRIERGGGRGGYSHSLEVNVSSRCLPPLFFHARVHFLEGGGRPSPTLRALQSLFPFPSFSPLYRPPPYASGHGKAVRLW